MSDKYFFSQTLIDSWHDDEKVKMGGDALEINTPKGKREYSLEPACRVLGVSGGGEDPHGVVGMVLTEEELAQKGADLYLDSCIFGETPYDVEPGYMAVMIAGAGAPSPKAEEAAAKKADETGESSEDDLLADYLKKTLS